MVVELWWTRNFTNVFTGCRCNNNPFKVPLNTQIAQPQNKSEDSDSMESKESYEQKPTSLGRSSNKGRVEIPDEEAKRGSECGEKP
ncbi:uncharacterized protein PGTG_21243 [Puccinia graminis f. sp. tritici CRL 75-36-700-3]|uniref:Uncharacterized protein n=1 Tax=Puccinia graminis f. sp. tritici (strain CRL 75-36-700-3 / race SCCL) TaxID=418459 RepID=H6QQU1_PUCGT|nr:uncharacterized protein PGTG_21243 [Puccinia graminis f. sp. tritici CRL 75-36-700-3]EHS62870.1 hypothetical protein PGTG_21243 [Puccinia graminis f. sp. tritici CRL 75-36-700-3]